MARNTESGLELDFPGAPGAPLQCQDQGSSEGLFVAPEA